MNTIKKESKFRIWWNSPNVKRIVAGLFSAGAAVVILGALFKIMHWPGAGIMLTTGMSIEAILFSLGVFDKPYKEFDWDKVFSFDGRDTIKGGATSSVSAVDTTQTIQSSTPDTQERQATRTVSADVASLSDSDLQALNSSISNLSETAKQLSSLSDAAKSSKEFIKNIEAASSAAEEFTSVQDSLKLAGEKLSSSYNALNKELNSVEKSTKSYAENADNVAKVIASINSIYEIQLQGIQVQAETLSKQTENSKQINENLVETLTESKKMNSLAKSTTEEFNKYKEASAHLTTQITELNKIYGNMLNALS